MKRKILGLLGMTMAVFGTTAMAATQVVASGCCPLCK
jgi:hypothetical protein